MSQIKKEKIYKDPLEERPLNLTAHKIKNHVPKRKQIFRVLLRFRGIFYAIMSAFFYSLASVLVRQAKFFNGSEISSKIFSY